MIERFLACVLLIAPGAATAQSNPGPQDASADRSGTVTVDPGRPSERDGLSARGGAEAIRSNNAFAETIGRVIYSPVGTTVNSQRIAPR